MRPFASFLGLLIIVMALAGSAFAAELSREQYKAAAEPICKKSALSEDRALANFIKEVRHGMLSRAGSKIADAAKLQARAVKQLKALPQPVADESSLHRWLSRLSEEGKLMAAAARKLEAGDEKGAIHPLAQLRREGLDGGLELSGFGFHYCQLLTRKVI
jgi:hypothetical protein